jgi:PAS fold
MTLRPHLPKRITNLIKSNLITVLENSQDVSYILNAQFKVKYCNPAWDRFAHNNCGHRLTISAVLGSPVWDFTPWELQPFFAMVFDYVHSRRDVWRHTYDCSSPRVHRLCEMSVHPLAKPEGYLVTNTMLIQEPHGHSFDPNPLRYYDSKSKVIICSHCRCTRAVDDPMAWDFVPSHLGLPFDQVESTLCPLCRAYLYAPSLWLTDSQVQFA